jgi:hypothetical protein
LCVVSLFYHHRPSPTTPPSGADGRDCTDKFDENGDLTDDVTRQHVQKLIPALVAWAKKVKV